MVRWALTAAGVEGIKYIDSSYLVFVVIVDRKGEMNISNRKEKDGALVFCGCDNQVIQ